MTHQFTFIDLFAGCGGLSLGLASAGWKGIFAIEKARHAFLTFHENFLEGPTAFRFNWPVWLPKQEHEIGDVLRIHRAELLRLRGQIDLVAGGPPCQGFSYSGRRKAKDPRNNLFEKYVEFVELVRPNAVLVENVLGMKVPHGEKSRVKRHPNKLSPMSHYERLVDALRGIGYEIGGRDFDASTFGVPQRRPRIIAVGISKQLASRLAGGIDGVFETIESARLSQLRELGLDGLVSASDAISDLQVTDRCVQPCTDPWLRQQGYLEVRYLGPRTPYQELMHAGTERLAMDSMRLAKHSNPVAARFRRIQRLCRPGMALSESDRARLGMLKHRTYLMHPDQPSRTLTTLPDDILHYSEPRILTVREYARLQSFPDWFKFQGKYTTGGESRRHDCPRYTQVGNAVPPLLARGIGGGLARVLQGCSAPEAIRPQISPTRETAEEFASVT